MKTKIRNNRIFIALMTLMICLSGGRAEAKNIITVEMKKGVALADAVDFKYMKTADSLIISGPLEISDFETLYYWTANGEPKGLDLSHATMPMDAIPDEAFYGEHKSAMPLSPVGLEYITLPKDLKWIGHSGLRYLKLKAIDLPETLEGIGEYAFFCDNYLDGDLKIPGKIDVIREGCFSACGNLGSVTLPEGLIEIEKNAFDGCNLDSIVLPGKLEVIESGAFNEAIKSKVYSLALTPPDCYGKGERSPFHGCYDCTLYVPAEALEAYSSTYPWSEFKEIKAIGDKSGVEDISIEPQQQELPVYDLTGRKMTKTVPGQIYIRGGKKFIAE